MNVKKMFNLFEKNEKDEIQNSKNNYFEIKEKDIESCFFNNKKHLFSINFIPLSCYIYFFIIFKHHSISLI